MSVRTQKTNKQKLNSFTAELLSILTLHKNRINLESLRRDYEIFNEKKLENEMKELGLGTYSQMASTLGLTINGPFLVKPAGNTPLEQLLLQSKSKRKKKR